MNPLFQVHKLNETGIQKARGFAEAFEMLLKEVEPLCYPGRELALVKTHLELACFYTKKAMAIDPTNHEAP